MHLSVQSDQYSTVHESSMNWLSGTLKFNNLFLFLFICVLAIALRLIPIWGNNFSYLYDSAKDSLVMYEMWTQKNPALVGPTTSIPGLFYGPAWYYLALPLNVVMDFHPLAGLFTLWLFVIVTLALLYFSVSKLSAYIYAIAIGMVSLQQTAWTPYMTSFFTLPVLVILQKFQRRELTTLATVGLAGCVGLMFHVQVAYAVVFLPVTLLAIKLNQVQLRKKWLLFWAVIGVCLLPSFIFELKHQFIQTKAVIQFVREYKTQSHIVQPNQTGIGRIDEISQYVFGGVGNAMWPISAPLTLTVGMLILLTMYLSKKSRGAQLRLYAPFIIGTYLLYLILPAKPYYFVALAPIWLLLFSEFLSSQSFSWRAAYVAVTLPLAVWGAWASRQNYQRLAAEETFLFSSKVKAVESAYQLAEGEPFVSYQYVPEIYDYVYQLIYLRKNLQGKPTPSEFSYRPGTRDYILQKTIPQSNTGIQTVILIVEHDQQERNFLPWWESMLQKFELESSVVVNDKITVHKARPL